MTDRYAFMFVERTDDKSEIALFLFTAFNAIPNGTIRTFTTESRSDLVESLATGARNTIEPAVGRTGGNWGLNGSTTALFHEVSTLANAGHTIPIGVEGAGWNDSAGSHDELISLDTNTGLLNWAVNLVFLADRNSDCDALPEVVSEESLDANALNSIENFIGSA